MDNLNSSSSVPSEYGNRNNDVIRTPVVIRGRTLRNRVVFAATTNNLNNYGEITDSTVAFYTERARGGVAAIVTESLAVHPTATGEGLIQRITPYDERKVPMLSRLAKAVHHHDTLIYGQLFHGGRQHLGENIPTLLGVSEVSCPQSGGTPHVLETAEVREIVKGFAQSAVNLEKANFDGVELHGAHGHLINQFLSPYTNNRNDRYGGSFENRLRFLLEIIEEIRATTVDLAIGLRINVDDSLQGGVSLTDTVKIVEALSREELVDYLSVSTGVFDKIDDQHPGRGYPNAPFVHNARLLKQKVSTIPVFAAGKIPDPVTASEMLKSGSCDVIALSRPLIADPFWMQKVLDDSENEIRLCTYRNKCWGQLVSNAPIRCLQNPATGKELKLGVGTIKPARKQQRVAVIGGGPAGLEMAITAAQRGFRVHLFEKRSRLGGIVQDIAGMPDNHELLRVVQYRIKQLNKYKIKVSLNREISSVNVNKDLFGHYDKVIVATGASDSLPVLQGKPAFPVLGVYEYLAGNSPLEGHILIYDNDGYYAAPVLANAIATRGLRVSLVTNFYQLGREIPVISRNTELGRLDQLDIPTYTNLVPHSFEDDGAVFTNRFSGKPVKFSNIGGVIFVGAYKSNCSLYRDNDWIQMQGKLIGDAYQPRRIADAIREGHLVARDL